MRLSEKGKEKLQGLGFAHNCDGAMALLDDYEFELEDFTGVVILTVEEAEKVLDAISVAFAATERMGLGALMEEFAEKVEQAEGKE